MTGHGRPHDGDRKPPGAQEARQNSRNATMAEAIAQARRLTRMPWTASTTSADQALVANCVGQAPDALTLCRA